MDGHSMWISQNWRWTFCVSELYGCTSSLVLTELRLDLLLVRVSECVSYSYTSLWTLRAGVGPVSLLPVAAPRTWPCTHLNLAISPQDGYTDRTTTRGQFRQKGDKERQPGRDPSRRRLTKRGTMGQADSPAGSSFPVHKMSL